ncbi:MAG: NAD-dependent epimerase/dehydratase family protein [Actinomycetes bacterium]
MKSTDIYRDHLDAVAESYRGKNVLVTGGASFISSHMVEELVHLGAQVRVADDLSSGKLEHLADVESDVEIIVGDLRDPQVTERATSNTDIVFHMAADHGGRGYIDTHPVECLGNMALDHMVMATAARQGASTIVHASSACAYPIGLQDDADDRSLLSEDQAGFDVPGKAFADGAYGWAKIMGEYQLAHVASQFGLAGVSCRIFTAYGERENESHAAVALMAKAHRRMDPYPVWGDGTQTRNFTHVADTATGLILAGAKLAGPGEFDVINVGTDQHYTINQLMDEIFTVAGWRPESIDYQLDKPVGVKSRAADCTKSLATLGWVPSISLADGVKRTYEWYARTQGTEGSLDDLLMTR